MNHSNTLAEKNISNPGTIIKSLFSFTDHGSRIGIGNRYWFRFCMLSLTVSCVSQLSANNSGLKLIPEVITDGTVCVVLTNFNTTLQRIVPSHQLNISIRTILRESETGGKEGGWREGVGKEGGRQGGREGEGRERERGRETGREVGREGVREVQRRMNEGEKIYTLHLVQWTI